MELLMIDGVVLKNPTKYDIEYADLDSENSYTSETGVLVRDMIRSNHVTITVEWNYLTSSEVKSILQTIKGKSEFKLTYLNTLEDAQVQGRFYAQNRKVGGKLVRLSNGLYSLSTVFSEF